MELGGGASGERGPFHYNSYGGDGATQSGGNAFGKGGDNTYKDAGAGGGGGLYGGFARKYSWRPEAGGSGYIGGVPAFMNNGISYSPSTTVGQKTGHGQAKITFICF